MNYLLKLSLVLLLGVFMTACSTDESNADEGVVAESFGLGSSGDCLELVYPVSFEFSDGTTVEVASKEELQEAKADYKENNPDERARAQLLFPVDLINAEGETITVESKEALKELKKAECGSRNGNRTKCFELIYPVSYVAEDGTVITGESKREIKMAVRAWKEENPDAEEKPMIQYPIQILNSEGETIELASADELAAIKEECKG